MKYIPTTANAVRVALSFALVIAGAGAVAGPATAQSGQPAWADDLFDEMGPMVETYNANINASELGMAADQLRNQNVNLVVTDVANDTTATVSFRMDSQLKIQELEQGSRDDATLEMSTDKATMDSIIAADNPAVAFQNALTPPDSDITISGIGVINEIRWAIINVIASLLG